MEDAKAFLRQIRKIDILINNKQKEIDALRSNLIYPGISYEERVQTSRTNSREKKLLTVIEYEHELNATIDNLISVKKKVASVIDQLDNPDMIDILYKRYFQFEKWEDIAEIKGYTYQGLHKIHAKALIEIHKKLNS